MGKFVTQTIGAYNKFENPHPGSASPAILQVSYLRAISSARV